VFGKVVAGMPIVRTLENVVTDKGDKPFANVVIGIIYPYFLILANCGELELRPVIPVALGEGWWIFIQVLGSKTNAVEESESSSDSGEIILI
jgi:hypothetical protein